MNQSLPTFERLLDASVPRLSLWSRHTTPAQRRTLLRLIATAQEERLSLIPLLEAHLEDERGPQKRRIRFLLRFLRQGTPLADAIEQVPGILSDEEMLSIRFGAQSGILAQAIRSTLDDPPLVTPRTRSEVRKAMTYVTLMLPFTLLALIIAPKMIHIFDDFGVPPNVALQILYAFGDFVSYWSGFILLAAIAMLWLTFSTNMGRFVRRAVAGRIFRSLRQWRAAEVLQRLGLAAHTGRPLPGVLSTLARYHFDQSIRHKLLDVRNEVELGADLWQSLAAVQLLTPNELNAVQAAARMNNHDWTLNHLAIERKLRIARRLESLSNLLLPGMVFAVAIIVMLHAFAVFQMLAQLIFTT